MSVHFEVDGRTILLPSEAVPLFRIDNAGDDAAQRARVRMPREVREYINDYMDEQEVEFAEVRQQRQPRGRRRHVRLALTVKPVFCDPLVRHNVVLGFEELLRWLMPRLNLGDPFELLHRQQRLQRLQREMDAREAELDRRERDVTKRERLARKGPNGVAGYPPGPALWEEEEEVARHDVLRDWVRVRRSKIPDSGSGVFALCDFRAGDLVTCVNGTIMTLAEAERLTFSTHQVESDTHAVRINARERALYATAPHAFTSGVGMFVNSADFTAHVANVRYQCVHPRSARTAGNRALGTLPKFYIQATRDIRKGEELLVPTYGIEYWRRVLQST